MEPHLRLTSTEVKTLYRQKLLTSRGLVYLYLTASRKKGWKLRGLVSQLIQELGISERQFYRALKDLSACGLIDFTIHGEISIWAIDSDSSVADLENFRYSSDSATDVSNSDKVVSNSDKVVSDSDKVVSKNPLGCGQGGDSSSPSSLYISSHSLSPSPPATLRERGEEEEVTTAKKEVKAEFTRVTDEKVNICEGKNSAATGGDEKKEIDDRELLEFIQKQNPSARNPVAYARSCLRNDRAYWEQEYLSWHLRREAADRQWQQAYQAYQEYRPETPVVDPEKAAQNIRRIREMLTNRGVEQ